MSIMDMANTVHLLNTNDEPKLVKTN